MRDDARKRYHADDGFRAAAMWKASARMQQCRQDPAYRNSCILIIRILPCNLSSSKHFTDECTPRWLGLADLYIPGCCPAQSPMYAMQAAMALRSSRPQPTTPHRANCQNSNGAIAERGCEPRVTHCCRQLPSSHVLL